MVVESRSAANARRRRRRRQRRTRIALAGGSALVVAAVVLLAFMYPPSFLSPTSEKPKPSPRSGEPVPAVVDEPLARLAITGDTGERNAAVEATAKRMQIEAERGEPYDALVILGDLIYPDGDADLLEASITEPFARVLDDAQLVPVLGNHDVQSGEEREIMSRLGRDTYWYVQKIGPVRLIALDSTRIGDERQMAWLRKVLAEKQPPGTWTITAMHHAPLSAGYHGSDKKVQRRWVPLFEQAKVPLVLAAHEHDYQRSTPQNGITYVVSGGGSKLRKTGREDFTAVSASILHYVDLLVYDDRLEGRAIDQNGELIDSFTIRR